MSGNLRASFRQLDEIKKQFPELNAIGDRDIARAAKRRYGKEVDMDPIIDSSGLMNVAAKAYNSMENAGQAAETGITGALGDNFFGRALGRAANQGIQQGPELALTAVAGRFFPVSKMAGRMAAGGVLGSAGMRAYTDTGSPSKALGSMLANAGSIYGSIKGGHLGRAYLSRNLGRAGAPVGAFLGGVPGDVIDEGVTDGMEGVKSFFDPVNLAAYGIVNAVSDTGMTMAQGRGLKKAVEQQQNLDLAEGTATDLGLGTSYNRVFKHFDIPDNEFLAPAHKQRVADFVVSKTMSPTEAQMHMLEQVPPESQSEDMKQRLDRLKHQLNVETESAAGRTQTILKHLQKGIETFPELGETVDYQLDWLDKGKRKVVMVPNGTKLPELYGKSLGEKFPKLETDRGTYVYDPSKIEPQEIMDAEANNTIGDVLDYGIPAKPPKSRNAMVLRDKEGIEKLSVAFDNDSLGDVWRRMQEVYEPEMGDTLLPESFQTVLEGRRPRAKPRKKSPLVGNTTSQKARKAYSDKINEYVLRNTNYNEIPIEQFAEHVHSLMQEKPGEFESLVAARLLARLQGTMKTMDLLKPDHPDVAGAAGRFISRTVNGKMGPRKVVVANDLDFIDTVAVASHELSHAGLWEYMINHPEEYAAYTNTLRELGPLGRKQIISDLADLVGLEINDVALNHAYQPDNMMDQDSRQEWVAAAEFTGGMVSLLHGAEMVRANSIDNAMSHFRWMPPVMTRALQSAISKVVDFFNKVNGALQFIPKGRRDMVLKAVASMDTRINSEMNAQRNAYNVLKNTQRYDPDDMLNNTSNGLFTVVDGLDADVMSLSNSDMRKTAKEMHKMMQHDRKLGKWEEMLLSGLSTARLYPAFKPVFDILHNYRGAIKEIDMSYMAWLGQYNNPNLSRVDGIKTFMDWMGTRAGAFANKDGKVVLGKISQYIADMQNTREQKGFGEKDILTPEQISEKYNLDIDDAKMAARLLELPQLVAQQSLNFQIGRDQLSIARLLYSANKNQDQNEVLKKSQALTRAGHQMGELLVVRKSYQADLEKVQSEPGPMQQAQLMEVQERINMNKAEMQELRVATEANLRVMFDGQFEMHPEIGKDAYLNQVVNMVASLGMGRVHSALIMSKPGYAPEVRRGNFLVTVYHKNEVGENVVLRTEGYDKKRDAEKAQKKAIAEHGQENVQFTDKSKIEDRIEMYNPRQLKHIQTQMREEFNQIAERMKADMADSPSKTDIVNAIIGLQAQFRPMQQELKEVMAVRGDGTLLPRKRVKGFDKNDYIPNIIEYMSTKTVSGQRGYTRAYAEYYGANKIIEADPRLRRRTDRTINYVLSQTNEAANIRSSIFYMYLGASIRHLTQNFVQPFLAGTQLIADGGGMKSYKHFGSAYIMLKNHGLTGTTGDKVLDALLLEADRLNVTVPNAIEFLLPQTNELSDKVMLANEFVGQTGLGRQATKVGRDVQRIATKFLRSTALVSETINRRASFIAAYNMHKSKGVTDAKQLLALASDFTNNVNFIGDKSNRPGFQSYTFDPQKPDSHLHSTVMTLTALQSFTINQISQMYTFFKEGRLGSRDVANGMQLESPGLFKPWKNPSSHALIATMGHLWLVSGILGMVGAEVLDELFEKHFGISLSSAVRRGLVKATKMADMSEESGNFVADLALKGLPTAMGIDASNSLGLGSPVQVDADREVSALDLAGPLGGIIKNVYNAADQVAKEPGNVANWELGGRMIAPQTMKHMLNSYDVMFGGEYLDRQKRPIVSGVGTAGSVSTLLGYTPRQVSMQREAAFKKMGLEQDLDNRRTYTTQAIASDLFQYEQDGDEQRLLKAKSRFMNYLNEAPTQDIGSMVDSIQYAKDRLYKPTVKPGGAREASVIEEVRDEYPSAEFPYQSAVDSTLGGLEVSQMLGQEREVLQRLRSLPQELPKKFLLDRLTEAGIHPAYGSMFSQHGKTNSDRLLQLVTRQDPYLAELLGIQ